MAKREPVQSTLIETISDSVDEGASVKPEDVKRLRSAINGLKSFAGFPTGTQDEITNLSLPIHYTACPNPFVAEALSAHNSKSVHVQLTPYSDDVSVGKNDPLYFAHYYSTKVPPHAILPYILHYTRPGDVVLDGFCGTGMTGVACQLAEHQRHPNKGLRNAILVDLSPAATFIAAMTNSISSIQLHLNEIEQMVNEIQVECEDLLITDHNGWPRGVDKIEERKNAQKSHATAPGKINYIVWSDVFTCSECGLESPYWDLVFRGAGIPAPKQIKCPRCNVVHTQKTLQRVWVTVFDQEIGETIRQGKQVPVLINYSVGKKRFEKYPDQKDIDTILDLENRPLRYPIPIVETPYGFNTEQPKKSHGFTHVHHFFTHRNLILMSEYWGRINKMPPSLRRNAALYLFTGAIQRVWKLNRYMPAHDRHVGPLSGTLYVSQITAEIPVTSYILERIKDIKRIPTKTKLVNIFVSTQSTTDLHNIPDNSVDYIFTDPPFGGNLNYSELNVFIEAWLGVRSSQEQEAIVNTFQEKTIDDYTDLMTKCFLEYYRTIKPGKWITVEFHNSENAVWNSIQDSLGQAGFVVADVRTLDKQKGTTKQLSFTTSVKQDLIISAYKPNDNLEERFRLEAGTTDGAWDFVRYHLSQLPKVVEKNKEVESLAERQAFLLFDRMVAFHIQRGVSVPLSAGEFYAGLKQKFIERDGMYFLPNQIAEYDSVRLRLGRVTQFTFIVSDEKTAIQWLRQQLDPTLGGGPQTFADLQPRFMPLSRSIAKHEQLPELGIILEQNFLEDEGGHWRAPDPSKATDLERLRLKALLREFDEYVRSTGRLTLFRTEAVRAGFAEAYKKREYKVILAVAARLPEDVLHEDPDLLMYYDTATLRAEQK
jgi:DNA modification methylase